MANRTKHLILKAAIPAIIVSSLAISSCNNERSRWMGNDVKSEQPMGRLRTQDSLKACIDSASAMIKAGNTQKAEKYVKAGFALDSSNAMLHYLRGMIASVDIDSLDAGERAAVGSYTEAIKLDPSMQAAYRDSGIAYMNLGASQDSALREKNMRLSICAYDDLKQAIRLKPNDIEAYICLLNVLMRLERYDEAALACQELLKAAKLADTAEFGKMDIMEARLEAYQNGALAYFYTGKYGKAIEECDKACKINPMYYRLKAEMLGHLGRDAEALQALEKYFHNGK